MWWRVIQHRPLLLFGPDPKYVPLSSVVAKVKEALEDEAGPSVVTVHGGPGMGKSSLAKYVALQYENLRKLQTAAASPPTFPHGVFYLYCGMNEQQDARQLGARQEVRQLGVQQKVRQLRLNLLQSLGGIVGASAEMNNATGYPEEEGEFVQQRKLRFLLAEQKLLIIIDDVWDEEVLTNLVCPGKRVKYLVTSQIKSIWNDAQIIELKNPTMDEARNILVNHTRGLPINSQVPQCIQSVVERIIRKVEYHPLTLSNVGGTMIESKATSPGAWETVKECLGDSFDENDFQDNPQTFQIRYPFSLGTSMMMMVDSVRPEARSLLLLMVLLQQDEVPEVLVKYFYQFVQLTQTKHKYQRHIGYLEDRSLIELRRCGRGEIVVDREHGERSLLAIHGLRRYHITKHRTVELKSIAIDILSGDSLGRVLGLMYFDTSLEDVVSTSSRSQSQLIDPGTISRSLSNEVDVAQVMEGTCGLRWCIESLLWLLNPDGEGGWKQQAHDYTKKILLKLAIRKELDDESMARLIQMPQTTTAACHALWLMNYVLLDHPSNTLSHAHGETVMSLLGLLHDDRMSNEVTFALDTVLEHGSGDETIRSVGKKSIEFLAMDTCPTLQTNVAKALWFGSDSRWVSILVGEVPQVLDRLWMLIMEGTEPCVQWQAADTISRLFDKRTIASRMIAIPGIVETVFKKFSALAGQNPNLDYSTERTQYYAGEALIKLSSIPENNVKFTNHLKGLSETFTSSLNDLYEMYTTNQLSESCHGDLGLRLRDLCTVAEIIGNLALTNESRKTILANIHVQEVEERFRLLLPFIRELDTNIYHYMPSDKKLYTFARMLTILDPLEANPSTILPTNPPPEAYFEVYRGRYRAYGEMRMYSNALVALHLAHQYLQQMEDYHERCTARRKMRRHGIFFKAKLKDYTDALLDANDAVELFKERDQYWYLAIALVERGMLRRLMNVNIAKALADLDEAFNLHCEVMGVATKYACLKNRELVKYMMGDEIGAKVDGESIKQLETHYSFMAKSRDALGPYYLLDYINLVTF